MTSYDKGAHSIGAVRRTQFSVWHRVSMDLLHSTIDQVVYKAKVKLLPSFSQDVGPVTTDAISIIVDQDQLCPTAFNKKKQKTRREEILNC